MKRLFLTQTAAIVAMALWVCGGCVTDPGDGDVVGKVTQAVAFQGYHNQPGIEVQILAQPYDNGSSLSWELVGHATTSSTAITWDGQQWYAWSLSSKLPRYAWAYGYTGARATVSARYLLGGPQDFYTMVPDFWGCWNANPTLAGVINNCITGKYEADITTSDFCEGPVVPGIYGSSLGEYQASFHFSDGQIQVGEVRGSPLTVKVGGATCTRWASNDDYFTCPLIGSGPVCGFLGCSGDPAGVFRDAETAKEWLENPEPGSGDIGYSLSWHVQYSQPFGPWGASCRQTEFTGRGTVQLFSLLELRDHIETLVEMSIDRDDDGIPDVEDDCDLDPENYNGYEDHDGCPDVPPPPACGFGLQERVCGIGGAAPSGKVVVGIDDFGECPGTGLNGKWVKDYTNACSNSSIQICVGYDAPPGWNIVNSSVPSIHCSVTPGGLGNAFVAQKP